MVTLDMYDLREIVELVNDLVSNKLITADKGKKILAPAVKELEKIVKEACE